MKMNALLQLQVDIDERVASIREEHPNWRCRMGCDHCCHTLADVPYLTALEWELLQQGLKTLPPAILNIIRDQVASLTQQASGAMRCPMLDKSAGACRVYAYRPIACRTYGFYVQHQHGLYCQDIELLVKAGVLNNVVWGNQNTIERRLSRLGESKKLTEWFAEWDSAS
jgi:Fe-S-cluster containining protein